MASIFDALQQYAVSPEVTKAISGAATDAAAGLVKETTGQVTQAVTDVSSSVQSVAKRIESLDLEGMQAEYMRTMKLAKAVAFFTIGAMTATMISAYFSYKISETQQKALKLAEEKSTRRIGSNPRRRGRNQHRCKAM